MALYIVDNIGLYISQSITDASNLDIIKYTALESPIHDIEI